MIKSTDNNSNSKRIAKNTLLLYVRMLLTMAVALFTSRVVLNTLGVSDYGTYNVVGGIVAMFSMLSATFSSSVTRFLTFELGKNNPLKLKNIFSTSVTIYIALAIVIFILGETLGVWFLNEKLNIPEDRMFAANFVLQCSLATFMINLISVPYNAVIIAHERMQAFAYISILEVSLKLLIVYLLMISPFDKLIVYAVLLTFVAFLIRIIYTLYGKRHFDECRYQFVLDKRLLIQMSSFAGWNAIGSSSAVLRSEGINIIINIFCGTLVNAARAISFQVNAAVTQFTSNFMTAVNPQIIKSYASGDKEYMMSLVYRSAKFSFFLLLLLTMPILLDTNYILILWLKQVPEHTIWFVRFMLIFTLVESISMPLITVMLATGKIRNYQIIVGGIILLNLPLSYLLLRFGYPPESTILVYIMTSIFSLIARLIMLKRMINLSIYNFCFRVLGPCFFVSIIFFILPYFFSMQLEKNFIGFIFIVIFSSLWGAISIYFIGCNKNEKYFIRSRIIKLFKKNK